VEPGRWRPGERRAQLGGAWDAVSTLGAALLAPAPNGSRMKYTATVEVKVPLVGAKIESFVARRLAEGITEIQRFTAAWIAENG
jgi:hypothetical protein